MLADVQPAQQREAMLFDVLNGLFHAQVQYINTKQQPLIPDGVIKLRFV